MKATSCKQCMKFNRKNKKQEDGYVKEAVKWRKSRNTRNNAQFIKKKRKRKTKNVVLLGRGKENRWITTFNI